MKRLITGLFIYGLSILCHAQEPLAVSSGYSDNSPHSAIVIPRPESAKDPRNQYVIALLRLALEATEKSFGQWSIRFSSTTGFQSQSSILLQLRSGFSDINLTWVMTDRTKEQWLLPVRIPIYKGIIGYRVCLMNEEKAKALEGISTLPELINSHIRIGQGHDWPDTQILQSNGIVVVTSKGYDDLFNMLSEGQFDCFLRGLNEIFIEKSIRPQFELEQNIVIYYPSPAYFFVNETNIMLHKRIEAGLKAAIENGSFDKLFARFHDETLAKVRLKKRTLIEINNPLLSEKTPLDNEALWYKK